MPECEHRRVTVYNVCLKCGKVVETFDDDDELDRGTRSKKLYPGIDSVEADIDSFYERSR